MHFIIMLLMYKEAAERETARNEGLFFFDFDKHRSAKWLVFLDVKRSSSRHTTAKEKVYATFGEEDRLQNKVAPTQQKHKEKKGATRIHTRPTRYV